MAVSKEDILDTIAGMTVMEIVELISAMEEKFGVTAAVAMAAAPAAAAAAPVEEKTEFDVVMSSFGSRVMRCSTCVKAVMKKLFAVMPCRWQMARIASSGTSSSMAPLPAPVSFSADSG